MTGHVLIVGGAGVFGRRLAEGLRATTDVRITLAGRSKTRLQRVASAIGGAAWSVLDRDRAREADLTALAPDVVVDASGPYQGVAYEFARTVLRAGAHYVDFADARDFVAGFPVLDSLAREEQRAAITGASSTPALTHAALDQLCAGWRRIDEVRAGIAPGNRAPKGRSLVEAILSRAGAPTRVLEDGAWAERSGWSQCATIRIAGLGRRRFALVETPDLDLIPARFGPTHGAHFMASLELDVLHRGIEAIGALRRWGLWRSPEKWAGAFALAARLVEPLGTDKGAMFVEVFGRDGADRPCRARWTMIAPAGQGPYAPTLPALATVRKLLAGEIEPGARACVGLISLCDLAGDFARHAFETDIVREPLVSPFETALGVAFERAPQAVKAAHRSGPVVRMSGVADVSGAASPLAALAAWCVGFPRTDKAAPVRVTKRHEGGGREIWMRTLGARRFRSFLSSPAAGMVRERFGPLDFDMAVSVDADGLTMEVVGWRLLGLALPRFLAPRSRARETVGSDGRFRFDVPIFAPLLGRLTHYRGALALETPERAVKEVSR